MKKLEFLDLTPNQRSASRRTLPFKDCRDANTDMGWTVCQGLVGVIKSGYVAPLLLFGFNEGSDGAYSIAVYWHVDPKRDWLYRPYSIRTLRNFAMHDGLQAIETGLTYQDIVDRVHAQYPDMMCPSETEFYRQFGFLI